MKETNCRFCGTSLTTTFVDLGMSPLSNSFLRPEDLAAMEPHYPLHVFVCGHCFLVQLPEFQTPEHIFSDYAYFSSYSETWLRHAEAYTDAMMSRFGFGPGSRVVEIASNDGYLLQYFQRKSVQVLGIEPAQNVAQKANAAGIPTRVQFFGTQTAAGLLAEDQRADLLIGNNVLAHVPDLNDFVEGMKILLKPDGVMTLEFPHLMQLIDQNQFDTIYHEHFSYFSFTTVERVFAAHGIVLFDVEELPTHGGSLRIYGRHAEDGAKPVGPAVHELRVREEAAGFTKLGYYRSFAGRVHATKREILEFLVKIKKEGKHIAGYGAPAKGNTLLNYCGMRTDFLDYTVDRNPHKQGRYLPGTHIPIYPPERIRRTRPDYLLILPWNLKDEIMAQMAFIRDWGGRFVTLIPAPRVDG